MSNFDEKVFEKKSFGDLLKEVHTRNNNKEKQITGLITQLKEMITNTADALTLVPLVKGYLDSSIKNDDILVKMVGIVQNNVSKIKSVDESVLTDEDREQLLALAQEAMADKSINKIEAKA